MPATYEIRDGETDPVILELYSIDPDTRERSIVDLTGVSLADLRLRSLDKDDIINFPDSGSQLSITDAETGQVTFYPTGTDFDQTKKLYLGFVWVTDAGGYQKSFPSDGEVQFEILESY